MTGLSFDRDGIRGLSIRVAHARGKVLSLTDEQAGSDLIIEALLAAGDMAMGDAGDEGLPTMFADEPALKRAWNDGVRLQRLYGEMDVCPYCLDDHFDLCPVHDF